MPKLSLMGQVAFATLLAVAVYSVLVFWSALAQVPGGPTVSTIYVAGVFILVTVILLPLILWGQKLAYVGGLGTGIFGIIANILAIAGVFGELASESLIAIVSIILVDLVLIWSSWAAWRE